MKLHERYFIVEKARNQIRLAVLEAMKECELTYAEVFAILSEELATKAKYCLRAERHPEDPDKGGDEE